MVGTALEVEDFDQGSGHGPRIAPRRQ
jgi:hypothetical protein